MNKLFVSVHLAIIIFIAIFILAVDGYLGIFYSVPSEYGKNVAATKAIGKHSCEGCGKPADIVPYEIRRGGVVTGIVNHWYCKECALATPDASHGNTVIAHYLLLVFSALATLIVLLTIRKNRKRWLAFQKEDFRAMWFFLLIGSICCMIAFAMSTL